MPPPIVTALSELVPVDKLAEHPDNPNEGDVEAIKALIEANGFVGAITAQRSTGHILDGNHTWLAAKALGYTEVPVEWVDCTDEQALRILLGMNRARDLAVYREDVLERVLKQLAAEDAGLAGTGFNDET